MNNSFRQNSFFGGFTMFPPVIKLLLLSNTVIYVLFNLILKGFMLGDISFDLLVTKYFALNPLVPVLYRDLAGQLIELSFYPWQLVTYMFLHADFFHILINMLVLWMFGAELENLWGQNRFIFYYFLCGIGAGLCNLFIAPLFSSVGPTVGASGAIYGILVAFGYLFPNRMIYIYGIIPVKAKFLVVFYMLFEIFAVVGGADNGIAHFAHLGGGVVGLVYLMIYYKGAGENFFSSSNGLKDKFTSFAASNKRTTSTPAYKESAKSNTNVSDAKYEQIEYTDYKKEIEDKEKVAQDRIDGILDKLSEGGYQNLTPEEKKILFQESKKLR